MKALFSRRRVRLQDSRVLVLCTCAALAAACSNDHPPNPARSADGSDGRAREPLVETPKRFESTAPYRAKLARRGDVYLPTWFTAHRGTYDLIVHFHGL